MPSPSAIASSSSLYCRARPLLSPPSPALSANSVPSVNATNPINSNIWVTPYQHNNGYTPSNWPNPGGCTGSYKLLEKAFPGADCNKWSGDMKNQAIQTIAASYGYRILSSVHAPAACFQEVVLSAGGRSVVAIVLDVSVGVADVRNVGDVSQAVIEELGGVPAAGHIALSDISYGSYKTFPSPF